MRRRGLGSIGRGNFGVEGSKRDQYRTVNLVPHVGSSSIIVSTQPTNVAVVIQRWIILDV